MQQDPAPRSAVLHATCVAAGDRGLLILGAVGTGKSTLALQLIALGARLVSDDQVAISAEGECLVARCPAPSIRGLIEARGFGFLRLDPQPAARLILALDLDRSEPARLPPPRQITLLGIPLSLAHAAPADHLPFALWCHLQGAARELDPEPNSEDGKR